VERILGATVGSHPDGPSAPLLLPADADDAAVMGALVQLFGQRRDLVAAEIVVAGTPTGWLARSTLLVWLSATERGIGDADHAELPGRMPHPRDVTLIHLVCPEPGCPIRDQWALSFDPASPHHCARHRDLPLRPAG
jgi:hypothetical protein